MRRRHALIAAATATLMTVMPLAGSAQAAKSNTAAAQVPAGRYLLVSENPEAGHLDFAPYTVPIYPPIYFIVGSQQPDPSEQWTVTPTGGGNYTINSTTHPRASWALRGQTIVASEAGESEFSIQPAGNGSYRIAVPNEDEVATLTSAGSEQLHVESADGSDTQLWKLVAVGE